MAAIQWNTVGSRVYESGLDRGVLYVEGQTGVPWNGLTAVEEVDAPTVKAVHFDGLKTDDLVTLGSFSGVIRAFTYPNVFHLCEGLKEDDAGVYLTGQPPTRFGLCYRTLIGEGANDLSEGYKLHLLYNLTAVPSRKIRNTLALTPAPNEFTWNVTAVPDRIDKFRPTAHLILDSREIDPLLMADLEDILYGDDVNDPRLPSLQGITTFIRKWDRLIIVDNGDGTWTAIAQDPNDINMLSSTEFELTLPDDKVVWLDSPTNTHYQISSTDKNEEDL